MTEDFQKICQLLVLDSDRNKLALSLLKNRTDLKETVETHFQPILDILKKKTIRSLPSIAKNVCNGSYSSKQFLLLFQEIACKDLFPATISYVNISNRKLTKIPDWIGELKHLVNLDLSKNELTSVPDSIGNLTSLARLDLGCNQLTELPDSIGNLTSLTKLTVWENNLKTLPDSILNLTELDHIAAQYNHWEFQLSEKVKAQKKFRISAKIY